MFCEYLPWLQYYVWVKCYICWLLIFSNHLLTGTSICWFCSWVTVVNYRSSTITTVTTNASTTTTDPVTTGSDQSESVIEHCYPADNTSHTTDPGNTCCSYTTGTPGTDSCCSTTNSTDKYITAWWSITTFYTPKPGTYVFSSLKHMNYHLPIWCHIW